MNEQVGGWRLSNLSASLLPEEASDALRLHRLLLRNAPRIERISCLRRIHVCSVRSTTATCRHTTKIRVRQKRTIIVIDRDSGVIAAADLETKKTWRQDISQLNYLIGGRSHDRDINYVSPSLFLPH